MRKMIWILVGVTLLVSQVWAFRPATKIYSSDLPSKKTEKTFSKKLPQLKLLSDLSIERVYLKDCIIHVVIKNVGSGPLKAEEYKKGKLILELLPSKSKPQKHFFALEQVDPKGVLRKPQGQVDFSTGVSSYGSLRVQVQLSRVSKGKKGSKSLTTFLNFYEICGRKLKLAVSSSLALKRVSSRGTGIGYREATGVDFTAIPRTGTGYRAATGVNFTAVSPTGTGYREATGVNFAAVPRTGTGYREAIGVNFTAVSRTGVGFREATGVNFTAVPRTGTGYREATGVNFTAIPR